jgi:hypothetical protein
MRFWLADLLFLGGCFGGNIEREMAIIAGGIGMPNNLTVGAGQTQTGMRRHVAALQEGNFVMD